MIANITRGGSMGGVIAYLAGPGRENEHQAPEMLGGSPGVAVEASFRSVRLEDKRNQKWLAGVLDAPRVGWGREVRQRDKAGVLRAAHVWHCSLTLAPGEQLTREQWQKAGREFVIGMRMDGCEWAVVHHGKTGRDQLDHVHLVVNLVQTETGKPVSTHNDYSRAQATCGRLSRQLGLTELQGQQRHLPARERRPTAPRRLRQGVRHEIVQRYDRAEAAAVAAGRPFTPAELEKAGVVQRETGRGAVFALVERRDVAIPASDLIARIQEDTAATPPHERPVVQAPAPTEPEAVIQKEAAPAVVQAPAPEPARAPQPAAQQQQEELTDEQLDELLAANPELAAEIQAYRAFQTARRLAELSNPGTIQDVVDQADREKNTPDTARPYTPPTPNNDRGYER